MSYYQKPSAPRALQSIQGNIVTASTVYNKTELPMPKSTIRGLVPGIKKIQWTVGLAVASKYQHVHVSTVENGSIQNKDIPQCLSSIKKYLHSAVGEQSYHWEETFDDPIPITADKIYIGAIQDTGNAITYYCKIWWEPVSIPGIEQQQQVANYSQF